MPDIFTKKKRSLIMASVRNKDTDPEITVRKELFRRGYRYKVNDKTLPGSPDIVLPKYRTIIFLHGCFWHGHSNCRKAIMVKSNVSFWQSKITKNRERDSLAKSRLKKAGWKVIVDGHVN